MTNSSRSQFFKHGLTGTAEYYTWRNMKARCDHPQATGYENYGGRGIAVCERWYHSFESFLADMGPRPGPGYSIERDDNNGNYEPSNCRWATRSEQSRNRRRGYHRKRDRCPSGHEFTAENTYIASNGWRQCKICRHRHTTQANARRSQAAAVAHHV